MKNYQIKHIKYLSYNGKNMINAVIYIPNCKPKGIIQISHGMCEYINRYDDFMKYMVNEGFIISGNDHLGHGDSSEKNMYGFFGDDKGYINLVEDLHILTVMVKQNFGYDLPYFLLGHSMGSFIARLYLSKYSSDLSGAIICGTAGPNPMTKLGILASNITKKIKGNMYRSHLLDKMAFGSFNKTIQNKNSDKDWISRNQQIVNKYISDSKCMFTFTAAGFNDLMTLATLANKNTWFKELNKDLPIFMIAGDDDPVGNYGKTVKKAYDKLVKYGQKEIELKLYPGARHEILNEINNKEVYADVVMWINARID